MGSRSVNVSQILRRLFLVSCDSSLPSSSEHTVLSLYPALTFFSQAFLRIMQGMSLPRFLIVNADDFGLSPEVNRAVRIGFEHEAITDASLLIDAPYSQEARAIIGAIPSVPIGLHVDLDSLLGWSSPGKERYSRQELLRIMDDRYFVQKVRTTIEDQITAFLDAGLVPSHVDTHHHAHGFRPIFLCLVEAMERHGIGSVRFSKQGYRLMGREDIPLSSRTARWMEGVLRKKNIVHPHHFVDPARPFSLSDLPCGVAELMIHPSYGGEAWRRKDFEMITDPRFRTTLREQNIKPISFRELRDYLSSLTSSCGCD